MRQPSIELQAALIQYFRSNRQAPIPNRLINGYEGEQLFDHYIEDYMTGDYQVIRDFSFDFVTLTQVDTILITPTAIHVYEVKNYDADCLIENGTFHFNGHEIYSNPLVQVENIRMRFKGMLSKIGYTGNVHFYVVMVNPNCTMKSDSQLNHVIMRNEIKSHLKSISSHHELMIDPAKVFDTAKVFDPAKVKKAILSQAVENHHQTNFKVGYHTLQPGFICYECGSMNMSPSYKQITCQHCGTSINKGQAIKQAVGEMSVLGQQEFITAKKVDEYTNHAIYKRTVGRFLLRFLRRSSRNNHKYHANIKLFNFQKLFNLYKSV